MGQCQSNHTQVLKMRNQQLIIDNNNLKFELDKHNAKTESDLTLCVTKAARHPSFNMLKEKQDGYYELVMKLNDITRRQDAPEVFDITTVCYVARPSYILKTNALLEGKVTVSIVPKHRAIDIDTELDFKFAEFLLNEKK